MTHQPMTTFLLDTNILVGFIRKASWALRAREEFLLGDQDVMVVTSVVCQGEILALAEKRGWGEEKRIELASLLAKVPTVDINKQAILNAYALIDAWTHGKSVTAPHDASPSKPAVSMGKNDLWIAATAHASKATLLSTDKKFDHLDGVWLKRIYVDPH